MRHLHLGQSKYVPLHLLHVVRHHGLPHSHMSHRGMGYAGAKKKDIGSFQSISGAGKRMKPLKFKM